MENEVNNQIPQPAPQQKTEKGCLLSGALIFSLLGILMNAFISGVGVCVFIGDKGSFNEVFWGWLILLLITVYAIYAIFHTFKMRKKGAYGLLGAMAATIVWYLYAAFSKTPETDEARAGVVYLVVGAIMCAVCAIIVLSNIKKMK